MEQLFFRRPRILNLLHRLRLTNATSQTNHHELAALEKYAEGMKLALEIGTYQGVSAARIVSGMHPQGVLYCIDPWPELNGRPNPGWLICQRHLKRTNAISKIRIVRGFSQEVHRSIPGEIDFAFIDGDHSWEGIKADWELVSSRLVKGGVVCLHDTVVPSNEGWRRPDSVDFYNKVIARNIEFEKLEVVYSMVVLRRSLI